MASAADYGDLGSLGRRSSFVTLVTQYFLSRLQPLTLDDDIVATPNGLGEMVMVLAFL